MPCIVVERLLWKNLFTIVPLQLKKKFIVSYFDDLRTAAALRKGICPTAGGSETFPTAICSALSNIQTEFNTYDPLSSVVMK